MALLNAYLSAAEIRPPPSSLASSLASPSTPSSPLLDVPYVPAAFAASSSAFESLASFNKRSASSYCFLGCDG